MKVVINQNIPFELCDGIDSAELRPNNFYHNLLCVFGYPTKHPPVGALLSKALGLKGRWLVASPIHWQAGHNDVMVMAVNDSLMLSDEQGLEWFSAFSEFVAQADMRTHYCDPYTWLIECECEPVIRADPVHTLYHQSLMSKLSSIDASQTWQRFLTECQMYFSNHPLNRVQSTPSINGIWVWGDGQLNAPGCDQTVLYDAHELHSFVMQLCDEARQIESALQSLSKTDIMVLSRCDIKQYRHLSKQLERYPVDWYWNNRTYTTRKKNWFSRLWSR